ncbi:hypothetical protein DMH04_49000 [Kibdelosporangium aridum]|uniref:Uncharacterized protein n=1 Tax=Kibdelosporangium aridum TaxID=2030 RepID=A0A428YIJ4_KIBAR|nr:hypothetical protein [Kibdelosporangium aridum]RSM67400.1 hypothetical protein DMH04_49000 [Kibdelosporangium aridum]
MIDESDPAVVAMRSRFAEISAQHRAGVAQSVAEYQQGEAANKAYQDEVARREADQTAAKPPEPEPKNPWLSRRTAPRPAPADDDGEETGYYSNTWMQNR